MNRYHVSELSKDMEQSLRSSKKRNMATDEEAFIAACDLAQRLGRERGMKPEAISYRFQNWMVQS